MPTPEFIASPTPPSTPGPGPNALPTFWWDSTNGALNVWTTINSVTGRQGWLPISSPAANAALNASVVSVGPGQFDYIPAVVGSLGASVPSIPAGQVGLCYDIVNNQLQVVGSGGAVIRRSAAFT